MINDKMIPGWVTLIFGLTGKKMRCNTGDVWDCKWH